VGKLPGDPGTGGKALFAIGVRLPERNREWVRHELTDVGWRSRLTIRHLVLMLPVGVVVRQRAAVRRTPERSWKIGLPRKIRATGAHRIGRGLGSAGPGEP
jgi:hypothetical protein